MEYILQVIMNRTDLKVIDQTLQKDYKNLQGSAILGLRSKGCRKIITLMWRFKVRTMVLLQKSQIPLGLLDMNLLNQAIFLTISGNLCHFIVKNDVLGYNLPINHIRRRSNENREIF